MKPTTLVAVAAAAAFTTPEATPDPAPDCATVSSRGDAWIEHSSLLGPADEPYPFLQGTFAAIRSLDALPLREGCGFATAYTLSQRLLATADEEPWLRRPVRDTVLRAMRRAYRGSPHDRVQMFGQVRLMSALARANLVEIPLGWRPTVDAWADGWGPSEAERTRWRALMEAWLDW